MSSFLEKDPNEILDYSIDWSDLLESGEVIADSEWAISGNATLGSGAYAPTHDDSTATVWVQDGAVSRTKVKVSNTITTDSVPPRIHERSFYLRIVDK